MPQKSVGAKGSVFNFALIRKRIIKFLFVENLCWLFIWSNMNIIFIARDNEERKFY